jgi:hypothetical protein
MDNRILTLMICGGIMLLMYIAILALILADLWAGVRKAKKRGEYRTSDGYKRTIDKIARYYNMTFAMSLIDVIQVAIIFFLYYFYEVDIWMIPWFTLFATGYVAWVEVHSIWEPADIKEKKQQQDYTKALLAVIEQYGGAEKVIEMLINKQQNDGRD